MRGKRKQGRRQEEKKGATRDGEDGRRERKANGRERKGTKATSACEILVSQSYRGKHNPSLLSVSKIITSLLLHLG